MNRSVIKAMVRLRLKRLLRDRSGLFWFLIMPMVFSLLMANILGDWSGGSSGDHRPRLMIYYPEQDETLTAILEPLADNESFRVVMADSMVSRETAQQIIRRSSITAALFIPENLTQSLSEGKPETLELFYDSDRLSSQALRTLLNRAILKINTEAAVRQVAKTDSSTTFDPVVFAKLWANPRITLVSETLGRKTESGLPLTNAAQHTGPAYTLFFMMMFMLMGAKDLVAEREDRTLARLRASRASPSDLVLGFFLGGWIMGLIQAVLLLGLNSLVLGIDYGDAPLALILVVVLFAGLASAGSILLGSIARTGSQADGMAMGLTMILAALGGLWWPMEIVPEFMQTIGKTLPTGQAITVFHDMIGRGYGLVEVSGLLIGLGVWFVVALALATWNLRRIV